MSLNVTVGASMATAVAESKTTSLMRRVSQKAADKLRRRTSSTSHDHEERSGPVLMRNRSGSQSGDGNRLGIQHHDDDDEVAVDDQLDGPQGEGLDTATADRNRSVTGPSQAPSDGIVVPEELQKGTAMTRVTRKKKTLRTFKLDVASARVSWNPTKQSSRFYIDDMKEVRTGANARNYREELQVSSDEEDRWITIIYMDHEQNGKLKLLHVIAPTADLFNLWMSTLEAINRYRTEMMAGLAMQGEKFVDAHWRNYMANLQASSPQPVKVDRLSFEDVERLCRGIHVNCSRRLLKEKFRRADQDGSGYLNFQEFEKFVKLLKEREEVKTIWEEIVANPQVGMFRNEFHAFLKDVQKVDVHADSAQVDKVFRKFCRQSLKMEQTASASPARVEEGEMRMNREAFTSFLLSSSYNPPLLGPTANQTLDRPLNEYYCSSSHNTYLMGRQVAGESSVEGYIRVLQRGCRCVEIDCWDGDDGRPVVTHGRTGTTACLFSDVISAIGKYAFIASPYPVILSLEVHCSLEQQAKMAGILIELLGDKLVLEPFMTNSMVLPSPQELKHRILIKVKGSERKESSLLKNDLDTMDKRANGHSSPPPKGSGFLRSNTSSSTSSTASETDEHSGSGENKKAKKPATKIARELGALGVYCRGQKFRNFALPGEVHRLYDRKSWANS
jgi:phosphatidylinositol phospholipase C delta